MVSKIQKWGNSQGLRLSKSLLSEAHLSVGDEVEVKVESGRIIVQPSGRVRGRYKLKELVNALPSDYEAGEEEWGPQVGRETW